MREVLATTAYDQPITRREVSEKSGFDSSVEVAALREAGLITYGQRRATDGAPPTYVTTRKFEEVFGLDTLDDLPPLDEIELLRDRRPMPAELSGPEPGSEDRDDDDDGPEYDVGREEEGIGI